MQGRVFKFGRWIACGRFKELPIVGREDEGGVPLYMETDEGVIYKLTQNEDSFLMVTPLCRRDGKEIEPRKLSLNFTEQLFIPSKKEDSEEE